MSNLNLGSDKLTAGNVTVTSLSGGGLVYSSSGALSPVTTNSPLMFSGNTLSLYYNSTNLYNYSGQLNTIQDIATTSSPTFSSLTLGGGTLNFTGTTRSITTANGSASSLTITPGSGISAPNVPGPSLILTAGTGYATGTHAGGILYLNGGTGGGTNAAGGAVHIKGGVPTGTGAIGLIKLGLNSASDYSAFEPDGTLVFTGAATVFDDLMPNAVSVALGAGAPGFTAYNGNLKAYEFVGATTTKEIHMNWQMPHSYKEGTDIVPHLHLYIPNDASGGVVKFFVEYTWLNIDAAEVAATTTSGTLTVAAGAGNLGNKILSLGTITGSTKTISSIFSARIYRDPADSGDTFGSSVWLKAADIHYEIDTVGSRTISTK